MSRLLTFHWPEQDTGHNYLPHAQKEDRIRRGQIDKVPCSQEACAELNGNTWSRKGMVQKPGPWEGLGHA